jgi:predicted ATPase
MLHLTTLALKDLPDPQAGFPFNLPVIQALDRLEFASPVTFLVGENGSGKSTLLEAIACAANSIVVGSEDIGRDQTLASIRRLALYLRLAWTKHTH